MYTKCATLSLVPPSKQHTVHLIMKNKEGRQWGVYFNKDTESMQFNQWELIKKNYIVKQSTSINKITINELCQEKRALIKCYKLSFHGCASCSLTPWRRERDAPDHPHTAATTTGFIRLGASGGCCHGQIANMRVSRFNLRSCCNTVFHKNGSYDFMYLKTVNYTNEPLENYHDSTSPLSSKVCLSVF